MAESYAEPTELIRYVDEREADDAGNVIAVYLLRCVYPIVKRTHKGAWIRWDGNKIGRKFILLSGRKRFAFPTDPEALTSLVERKKYQIRILNSRAELAAQAMDIASDVGARGNPKKLAPAAESIQPLRPRYDRENH